MNEKIKVGIYLHDKIEMKYPEFFERIKDYRKYLEAKLLGIIEERMKGKEWGIFFIQVSLYTNLSFIDIYVNDIHDFEVIKNICESHIDKEFKIQCFFRGDVNLFLSI